MKGYISRSLLKKRNNSKILFLPSIENEFQKLFNLQSCLFVKIDQINLSAGLNFHVVFVHSMTFKNTKAFFCDAATMKCSTGRNYWLWQVIQGTLDYDSFPVFPETSFYPSSLNDLILSQHGHCRQSCLHFQPLLLIPTLKGKEMLYKQVESQSLLWESRSLRLSKQNEETRVEL